MNQVVIKRTLSNNQWNHVSVFDLSGRALLVMIGDLQALPSCFCVSHMSSRNDELSTRAVNSLRLKNLLSMFVIRQLRGSAYPS